MNISRVLSSIFFGLFLILYFYQIKYSVKEWYIADANDSFFKVGKYIATFEKAKPFINCNNPVYIYHKAPSENFDSYRALSYALAPCEITFNPECSFKPSVGFHIIHESCEIFKNSSSLLNVIKITDELVLYSNNQL